MPESLNSPDLAPPGYRLCPVFFDRILSFSSFFLGELSGSLMYTRMQTRLNPVPESLNSPDCAPGGMTASGLGRPPAKDDPIRVYNRELAVSSSTVSV